MDNAITPEVLGTSALVAVQRGEIDAQISTAKMYPRDPREFIQDAIRWATEDEDTAASCMYRLEKGGSVIEGPSVRLAEIAAQAYGNLRVASRLVAEQERFVTVEAVAHDLEKNNAQRAEVVMSIWGKHGRYGQDMIQTTVLAAQAKARRNAILAVIPGAWIRKIMVEVEAVNAKAQESLGQVVGKMLGYLGEKFGLEPKRVVAVVNKTSPEALTADDVAVIRTLAEEMREGRPVSDCFPELGAKQEPKKEAGSVQDMLKDLDQENEQAPPTPAPAKPPEEKAENATTRLRRLGSELKAQGVVKTQAAAMDVMKPLLKADKDISDGALIQAVANAFPPEGEPKADTATQEQTAPAGRRRRTAPKEEPQVVNPWHAAEGEALDKCISDLEDAAGEISADLFTEARQKCDGDVDDPEAPVELLRAYCDALHELVQARKSE